MSNTTTLTIVKTRSVAEHMAQWEIHELRAILAWMTELTAQAEDRGLSLAHLAASFESRVLRLHDDMHAELIRARAAQDGA